ncbi:MAG: S9 family peptidase [Sphingobacteriales bacterium]|nr:S9 family peptidase [Sphingobacteriales bacterium]MBI3720225.1 S9 family peptidase [Sphingobacteriales bacterium]
MIKRLLTVTTAVLFITISFAQTKQTITHESMWLMKRVGAPQVSPDGKWVVFNVTDPSYTESEQVSDLWIASTDGNTKPRRLTTGKGGEGGYQWSPDGKYLAFSTKREGDDAGQIYLLNIKDGGEAQRFTNLSTGASSPQWSPDGKSILFNSSVYPGAFTDSANKKIADDRKKIKYKARVYTSFPIRDWDHWREDKQTHIFIQSTEANATAKDIFTNVSIVSKEGFSFGSATWSHDGNEIIFSATTDLNTAAYQEPTTNLYKVSAKGGDATQLTSDGNDYGNAQMSSDGKYLLCYTSANNNYKVYNINKLVRFDWPSMQNKTYLTPALDRPVNSYTETNGKIIMSVEDQGNDKLFSLPVAGGTLQLLSNNPVGCYNAASVSSDGQTILCNYDNASMPPEVVKISNNNHVFISSFNEEKLKTLDLPQAEVVWMTSSRGKKIRSLLVRPAGFDANKKYPLFVVFHGGPAGSWKDNWSYRWNYHLLASPGYVLVLTDYTGSTGYGDKFAQDIQYDPFKGPANEINEAAADVIKRYSFIDGTKQAGGGASYGGHLANWMQATTTHYKCLIAHAGLVNSEAQYGTSDVMWGREVMNGGAPWTQNKVWKEQNPIRYAAKFKTPILVTVGEQDFRVPLNNSLENWAALQRMKVPSKLLVFPEENHWILRAENSRFWYSEVQAWLKKYLQ